MTLYKGDSVLFVSRETLGNKMKNKLHLFKTELEKRIRGNIEIEFDDMFIVIRIGYRDFHYMSLIPLRIFVNSDLKDSVNHICELYRHEVIKQYFKEV